MYDNKDLEPFNKMQGYLYSIKEANVGEDLELIELIPPTKDGLAELEKDGEDYHFISNVIIPCYFVNVSYNDMGWTKYYPIQMNEKDKSKYFAADPEYLYATDEELNDVFGNTDATKDENYQYIFYK